MEYENGTAKIGGRGEGEMNYVSDCCGKWIIEHEVEMPDGTFDESYECTKCNKPCTPVEQKSGGEEEEEEND